MIIAETEKRRRAEDAEGKEKTENGKRKIADRKSKHGWRAEARRYIRQVRRLDQRTAKRRLAQCSWDMWDMSRGEAWAG